LPPPIEVATASAYSTTQTLAVAPAINLSGSRDFDPFAVSDSVFEELQQVPGLNVLPLNRTLYAMRQLGIRSLDSAEQAQKVAEALGANALVVPAITSYNPYNPPVIGMILQVYTPRAEASGGAEGAVVKEKQPVSQTEAIFNATNQSVLHELRDFARGRTQYDTALQDEKFVQDADLYLRFVSHAMVRRLMEVERERVAGR
jgi:hypothetical protein